MLTREQTTKQIRPIAPTTRQRRRKQLPYSKYYLGHTRSWLRGRIWSRADTAEWASRRRRPAWCSWGDRNIGRRAAVARPPGSPSTRHTWPLYTSRPTSARTPPSERGLLLPVRGSWAPAYLTSSTPLSEHAHSRSFCACNMRRQCGHSVVVLAYYGTSARRKLNSGQNEIGCSITAKMKAVGHATGDRQCFVISEVEAEWRASSGVTVTMANYALIRCHAENCMNYRPAWGWRGGYPWVSSSSSSSAPSVSIAVSTSWRHFERSCARIHATLRPRLWGRRSSSIVRSHVRLGRPARRRQSAGGRLMAARRMREWSCDGSALARCPNRRSHHHHHHIYFRLPERPQKPIELATPVVSLR